MGAQGAYERIAADMRSIWGDMAIAMLRKRLRDMNENPKALTRRNREKIVMLRRTKTRPSTLGEEGEESRAKQYRAWVADSG